MTTPDLAPIDLLPLLDLLSLDELRAVGAAVEARVTRLADVAAEFPEMDAVVFDDMGGAE